MKLRGTIVKQQVLILVDSGSIGTPFLSSEIEIAICTLC